MREMLSEEQILEIAKKHDYMKVNLAPDIESYKQGNGEGIWAVIPDPEDWAKYKADADSGQFFAIACNPSVYYPGEIVYGSKILCEFRGRNRPMAVWDDLQGTKEAAKNEDKIMKRLQDEKL